jgi:hypothetical protein
VPAEQTQAVSAALGIIGGRQITGRTHSLPLSTVPGEHTQTPSTLATSGGGQTFARAGTQVNVFFTNSATPVPVILIGEAGA